MSKYKDPTDRIRKARPSFRRRRRPVQAASYKWTKQLTKHSDAAAAYAQKALRKEPALTAHRVSECTGCEKVTVKADRTKAEAKIGIDATDVADMKHVISVFVGDEMIKRAEFPIDMEEEELGAKAAEMLRAELKLAMPEPVEGEFGAERVASFRRRASLSQIEKEVERVFGIGPRRGARGNRFEERSDGSITLFDHAGYVVFDARNALRELRDMEPLDLRHMQTKYGGPLEALVHTLRDAGAILKES